jgi:hypothetical protein
LRKVADRKIIDGFSVAEVGNGAACGLEKAQQYAQQGCLAAAVGACDGYEISAVHIEVDVFKCNLVIPFFADIAE